VCSSDLKIIDPYISEKTVIGISTSLMAGVYYGDSTKDALSEFASMVNEIRTKHSNKVLLGGQSSNEYLSYFEGSLSLENFDGENDIVDFLIKEFNFGLHKRPHKMWSILNDDFKFPKNSFIQKEEMLPLELSRGCIFSCKFCSFSRIGKQKGSYEKNISLIKDYLIHNYENYKTQYYFLTSDTVNDNDERMNEWCDMLETLPFKIYYSGYFRIDLMNKYLNTTKRLYENGLRGINFGIETLHPEAARIIEKPFSDQRAKDLMLKLYHEIFKGEVCISVGMIVGLPEEPIENVYKSAEWYMNEGKVIQATFNPLTLIDPSRGIQSPHYSSKFSKNSEKYGFKWTKPDNPLYWEHKHTNYIKASVTARKINKMLKMEEIPLENLGPWNKIQYMACNGNFDFMKKYYNDIINNSTYS
jgi:radical SAM superfamily enzyme YgiQ (UPF0313 family)